MACPPPWYSQWPDSKPQWITQNAAFVVPTTTLTATEMQTLLDAKNGDAVAIKESDRIIYMGEKAYGAYEAFAISKESFAISKMERWESGPTALFCGIKVVCTKHLQPYSIVCADLNIQNELGDILKERIQERIDHAAWFKDQQRGNQAEAATSIYRLEEPNRIWSMVLAGLVVSWIIGLLYAWKIGLLILGR